MSSTEAPAPASSRSGSNRTRDDVVTAAGHLLAAGRSHDYREGVAAYLEKRAARFEGR